MVKATTGSMNFRNSVQSTETKGTLQQNNNELDPQHLGNKTGDDYVKYDNHRCQFTLLVHFIGCSIINFFCQLGSYKI
jgi:hypothetical protein